MSIEQNRKFNLQASIVEQLIRETQEKIAQLQNSISELDQRLRSCETTDHSIARGITELYRFLSTLQSEVGRLATEFAAFLHKSELFVKADSDKPKDKYKLEDIARLCENCDNDQTMLKQDRERTKQHFIDHPDLQEVGEIVSALNPQAITVAELERAQKRAEKPTEPQE